MSTMYPSEARAPMRDDLHAGYHRARFGALDIVAALVTAIMILGPLAVGARSAMF